MGQNQVLMIVLSVIVVGAGVAVGVTQFSEVAMNANQDAVIQDCIDIVQAAQRWYRKPRALGGGGYSFSGITLTALNIDDETENGTLAVAGNGLNLQVVGIGEETDRNNNVVRVVINFYANAPTISPVVTRVPESTVPRARARRRRR